MVKLVIRCMEFQNIVVAELARPNLIIERIINGNISCTGSYWYNHIFSLTEIVCELFALITHKPFLELLKSQCQDGRWRICRNCHEDFYITNQEKMWMINKNMVLPKRCKRCRLIKNIV